MDITSCQYNCLGNILDRRTSFTTPLFYKVSSLILPFEGYRSEANSRDIAWAFCSGFVDSARARVMGDAGSGAGVVLVSGDGLVVAVIGTLEWW